MEHPHECSDDGSVTFVEQPLCGRAVIRSRQRHHGAERSQATVEVADSQLLEPIRFEAHDLPTRNTRALRDGLLRQTSTVPEKTMQAADFASPHGADDRQGRLSATYTAGHD